MQSIRRASKPDRGPDVTGLLRHMGADAPRAADQILLLIYTVLLRLAQSDPRGVN